MNYLQIKHFGKLMGLYFNGDLSSLSVKDGDRELKLSKEDREALLNIIEQEVYYSVLSHEARKGVADA